MAEYRLYCFGESGNSYKAALMLALSGADWEPIRVDYFGGETRTPQFREQVSVMGEVPVLLHRGERMTQSGVILDYLAEQTGRFGPRDARERREIWRWLLFDNHKFTSYLATLRWMVWLQKSGESAVTEVPAPARAHRVQHRREPSRRAHAPIRAIMIARRAPRGRDHRREAS